MYNRKLPKHSYIQSKLLKLFLSWFEDKPTIKKSRGRRRSNSLQHERPRKRMGLKPFTGCCCIFLVVYLFIKYLTPKGQPASTEAIVKQKTNEEAHPLKEEISESSVWDAAVKDIIPKESFIPDPDKVNPSDWDLAFVVTPQIKLEAWSKSFENCFFEQKLSNELSFWAKFYLSGHFVFMETLKESRRVYTKSDKKFLLNFGEKGEDYMHVEFNYDLPTSSFKISINDEFRMEFNDEEAPKDASKDAQDGLLAEGNESWCNYDFDVNARYHIGCKIILIEDQLKHKFDSFEFEFVVNQ